MSPDDITSPKKDEGKNAKPDTVEDLKDPKLSHDDSEQVKGGLNPQPLPPRHNR
jgi:hypothetical protein